MGIPFWTSGLAVLAQFEVISGAHYERCTLNFCITGGRKDHDGVLRTLTRYVFDNIKLVIRTYGFPNLLNKATQNEQQANVQISYYSPNLVWKRWWTTLLFHPRLGL